MVQLDGCFEGVQLCPISGLVPSADYADPMGASALRRFISGGCGLEVEEGGERLEHGTLRSK